MKSFARAAVCLWACLSGAAQAQQWFAEDGQGIRSASIEAGNTAFAVSCVTTAATVANEIAITIQGERIDGMANLLFDRQTQISLPFQQGRFRAADTNAIALFNQVIALMKAGDLVEVYAASGAAIGIPLSGSSAALAPCGAAPQPAAAAPNPVVQKLETYLSQLGFAPGAVDGVADAQTQSAIAAYQQANGLPVTGGMSMAEFQQLEARAQAAPARPGGAVARPTSVKRVTPPQSADDITYHQIADCAQERGRAVVWYTLVAGGGGGRTVLALSDLCVNRAAGTVAALEPVQGLQLVRKADTIAFYEVVDPSLEAYQRKNANMGEYTTIEAGKPARIGAVTFSYADGPKALKGPRLVADAHTHRLNGFLFETSFPPEKIAGPMTLYFSGHDHYSHLNRGYGTNRDGETPYIAFKGKATFDGATTTATLSDTGEGGGKGSGTLTLSIAPDGQITGSGSFTLENARLAGIGPNDWKVTQWRIVKLIGHTVGSDGQELRAIGLATGETLDHDGVRTPVYASFSIVGYGPEFAEEY